MTSGFLDVLLLMATYTLWICLPLLPAILIYRLFPDSSVAVNGPFAGLTISAGGAFAAYFITLIASVFLMKSIVTTIRNPPNVQWTITGRVSFLDANGQPLPSKRDEALVQAPTVGEVSYGKLTARVLADQGGWPVIRIEQPGGASETIDFADKGRKWQYSVDRDNYSINIATPIQLRQLGSVQVGDTQGQ